MISFEPYNQKQYAVRGDRKVYEKIIKDLGGRWNARMRGGPGWLISQTQKEKLQKLVDAQSSDVEVVHDHKSQAKYHRERSRERQPEEKKDEIDEFYKSFKKTPPRRSAEMGSPSVSGSSCTGSSGNTYDDIEELFETVAFLTDRMMALEKRLEKSRRS